MDSCKYSSFINTTSKCREKLMGLMRSCTYAHRGAEEYIMRYACQWYCDTWASESCVVIYNMPRPLTDYSNSCHCIRTRSGDTALLLLCSNNHSAYIVGAVFIYLYIFITR